MAKSKEYAYYVKGNKIALVEKERSGSDGLNYTYDDETGLDIPQGYGTWKSPQSAVDAGLRVQFTKVDLESFTDESSTVPVDEFLCKAVVDYVKAKLAEDMGEIDLKEYHMREFHRKIAKYENTKFVGPRSIVPGVKWQQ